MTAQISENIEDLLERIQQVVGRSSREKPINLHEPDFKGTQAWEYVKECLDSGWVSTAGSWVNRFEQELCTITGAKHAVVVNNGTVALRLALHLVGVGPKDEVLLPPLGFVATANAISHLGAVPHFIDVEQETLGLCPIALTSRLKNIAEHRGGTLINKETGRRIAAVLPVHVFGNPAKVEDLRKITDNWGLQLVEDAAEALASWRGKTHCGLFGSVGTLSFNGNKLITTGGGGALITSDSALAKRARHISTTAKQPHAWAFHHDSVGWNDRLPNINAALGVAQLENLEPRLEAKRLLAKQYKEAFRGQGDVEIVMESSGCQSNNWLVCIRFTAEDANEAEDKRKKLLERAHSIGLLLRPIWKPLHQQPMYKNCPSDSLVVAEDQAKRLLNLPSSPQLIKNWKA